MDEQRLIYKPGVIALAQCQTRKTGNQRTRKNNRIYKDLIAAFDIETTGLDNIEQSIMYIWQFNIHGKCLVVGRTWDEFRKLLSQICDELEDNETLVIWVHNLSYEFQFLRTVYNFANDEVFAVDRRKVLKCTMFNGKIEFRCSYLHSNMSLAEYTRKMNVEHGKLSGAEFDYTKKRYPWTVLSEKELEYCVNDVLGLCEALVKEMEIDGDNLYTIPLTSTGYVRRDTKAAMRKSGYIRKNRNILPTLEIYNLLREAFRGGNTHANRFYSGRILKNLKSADRSSSYPDVIANEMFPMTEFQRARNCTAKRLVNLISVKKKAVLFCAAFTGIRLKNKYWGAPYLTRDKARRIENGAYDNGRILECDYMETTLTDVDFKIILNEYEFDDFVPYDVYYSTYGKLPAELTECVKNYYIEKTKLKGVDGQEVYYMKSKNKLNSIYGMMVQNPLKHSILYNSGEWANDSAPDIDILENNNRIAFLAYQWGVWVTAHARHELEKAIVLAGEGFVYCDTDSVKYFGDIDFSAYNNSRKNKSTENGAYATDPNGETHYMGVYESDGRYSKFITFGAKKYAYCESDDKTHITIAGVSKKLGGLEIDEHGGIESLKLGFIFRKAGGTESIYNDNTESEYISVDGGKVELGANIYIKPSTYTLGITPEYAEILENVKILLDKNDI